MYELFEQLIAAYRNKNEEMFKTVARLWIDNDGKNPFQDNSIEHNLFFKAKMYRLKWINGGIDARSSKRNMIEMVRKIMERNPQNPYPKEEPIKIEKKHIQKNEKKEQAIQTKEQSKEEKESKMNKEELMEDVRYLLMCMTNAYNDNNESSYEMYVTHLLDVAEENPFKEGTEEYEYFNTMETCWKKNPPNKRRSFVVGKQLCNLINNTEIEPEKPKQTVLGVLPDEKKSWFKFLFPWKREGESDDGTGTD